MSEFSLKPGDTLPPLRKQLRLGGEPVDLTTAESIRLAYRDRRSATWTTRDAVVDGDPLEGYVLYAWEPADTAPPGDYEYYFTVVWADGEVQSFPQRGVGLFTIEPGVAPAP